MTEPKKQYYLSKSVVANYHREPAEWNCLLCQGEVWIVHNKQRKYQKGMYCDCGHWEGFTKDLPKGPEEWKTKRHGYETN
jgi:hypothetical protein